MNPEAIIDIIAELHHEVKQVEKAASMKAYMKNRYEFLGVTAPERKLIFRELWAQYKNELITNWAEIVDLLWKDKYRESKYVAMEIIRKVEKQLDLRDLPFIERLITDKSWWDTVDFLASHAVGQILLKHPTKAPQIAHGYMDGDNMWLQRTSMIFQLFYKDRSNAKLMTDLIDKTIGSKEFFINKASGWALRQYARTDPEFVREYLYMKDDQLSNLTKREASKYL